MGRRTIPQRPRITGHADTAGPGASAGCPGSRAIARPAVRRPYLGLTNYVSNLRRLGWTDADLAGGGSDALIDALVVHGDAEALARGVTAHLDAGADHVAVQVLGPDPRPALRELAGALGLASS